MDGSHNGWSFLTGKTNAKVVVSGSKATVVLNGNVPDVGYGAEVVSLAKQHNGKWLVGDIGH